MKIVDTVRIAPGCCPITGRGEGPFVQTEWVTKYKGARFTPTVSLVRELAETIGMVDGDVHSGALADKDALIELLKEELLASQEDLGDYALLRGAIRATLRDGAVVTAGKIEPRPAGRKPRSLDELTALAEMHRERAIAAAAAGDDLNPVEAPSGTS